MFPVKHESCCRVLHDFKDLVSHKGITFAANLVK
nr:MAG TPA: hypothetical protein [Bacteriophage sp.]DAN49497.1 MAG TPA: hypothetical protein [Caudoviricetes sp.]DAW61043.1 MAG TPA: hypothetical protein [Caudoviricetes sp.]